ncbi:DNA-directed RNA polymerase specialized sigma24 family protein [Actinokineospora baliensis]|uniref:sigma factor-like helix-turn-helix DNA-binding protein n=1 Tax=Actinokineospora baliensis TaxID=547056 RepID=UPI00195ED30C|nr:sigma factor-like helix-turn-helix DNA-binding protein [Actinokineospora baliensis]MBM7770605.1 DNA-directed RNA polymerase specialized sigma24 family protein [Actinokineospora baliensis]
MSVDLSAGAFADVLRGRVGEGRPPHLRSTSLPGHLARLAGSSAAALAFADRRTTRELVEDVEVADPSAEEPLYVRVAADLDRVAGRLPADSAYGRDDLHQEGAVKLLTDARSGAISARFGGEVGPYLGRDVRRFLLDLVDTHRVGSPSIPGRRKRQMREALTATLNRDSEYDVLAAVTYAQNRFGWSLRYFWEIHAAMFAVPVPWHAEEPGEVSLHEVTEDRAAAEALTRVTVREDVTRLRGAADLTRPERDVLAAVTGEDGPVRTQAEAAADLGISPRHVRRLYSSALRKLSAAAAELGIDHTH